MAGSAGPMWGTETDVGIALALGAGIGVAMDNPRSASQLGSSSEQPSVFVGEPTRIAHYVERLLSHRRRVIS
jgi:hypothetical protein